MADASVVFTTDIDENGVKTGMERLKTSVGGMAGGVSVMLGNLAADAAKGILSGAMAYVNGAIEAASNLQEVQNVVDTTFGDNATSINEWAKAAKDAYGIGELKAKQYTSTMGAMLKSMGLTADETLDMSEGVAGLTGDMASFYNLDHGEAFEKIRAGISGETEPLKQLGINMSVANLEAFALAEGIETSYSKMSQGDQAILRYKYLMKATADAQGDFKRTSAGLANQQRILETTQNELAASIGELFLPVATAATGAMITLTSAAATAVNNIAGLFKPPTNELTDDVNSVTTAIQDIKDEVDDVRKNYAETSVEINIKYSKAEDLLADLAALQGESELTAEQVAKMQEVSASLVELYPGLEKYIGKDGIIHAEVGEVQALITEYTNLDKALAFQTLVSGLKQSLADVEAQAEFNAGLWDVAKQENEAAQQALQDAAELSSRVYTMTTSGALPTGDVSQVQAYLDVLRQYTDTFGALPDALAGLTQLPDFKNLLDPGITAEEISDDATAYTSLFNIISQLYPYIADNIGVLESAAAATATNLDTVTKNGEALKQQQEDQQSQYDTAVKVYEERYGEIKTTAEDTKASVDDTTASMEDGKKAADETTESVEASGEALVTTAETVQATVEQLEAAQETATQAQATVAAVAQAIKTEVASIATDAQTALDDASDDLIEAGETAADSIKTGFENGLPKMAGVGKKFAGGVASGISTDTSIKGALNSKIISATSSASSTGYSGGYSVGSNIMSGINAGLTGQLSALTSTMRSIVLKLLAAAQSAAMIKSPSQLFRDKVGRYLAEGIGVGFAGTMESSVYPAVARSMGDAAAQAQKALSGTLLSRVQALAGLQMPSVGALGNALVGGAAVGGVASAAAASNAGAVSYTQNITFESTMQAPDEIARAIRRQATYGLAGARP